MGGALCKPSPNTLLQAVLMGDAQKVQQAYTSVGNQGLEYAEADGKTALHLAAFLGKLDTVSLLLQLGSNKQRADASGEQPLHLASANGKADCCKALLKAGAPADARRQSDGRSALHLAALGGELATSGACPECRMGRLVNMACQPSTGKGMPTTLLPCRPPDWLGECRAH